MRYLKRSRLFTENLQHVRLNWLPATDWSDWEIWDTWYNKILAPGGHPQMAGELEEFEVDGDNSHRCPHHRWYRW